MLFLVSTLSVKGLKTTLIQQKCQFYRQGSNMKWCKIVPLPVWIGLYLFHAKLAAECYFVRKSHVSYTIRKAHNVLNVDELRRRSLKHTQPNATSSLTRTEWPNDIIQTYLELKQSKKTGPNRFSNSMLPGLAESVPGPAVTNSSKMCHVSCSWWSQLAGNPILQYCD